MEHRGGAYAPVRTCVGCRRRGSRSELLRVVARPRDGAAGTTAVVPDPACRSAGRGAWLHPCRGCLESAERRRAFGRALRVRGSPCAYAVAEYLAAADPARPEAVGG